MRICKIPVQGPAINIEDVNVGDVILVRRYVNSKSSPYWPYQITGDPAPNAHGFLCAQGQFLLPDGPQSPGVYSATARVLEHEGETWVVGKPLGNWFKNELKKAENELAAAQRMVDWLKGGSER